MMKRRFIAGAQCPQCEQLDTIVMYDEGDARYRECVECGFKDKLEELKVEEVPTRVNQSRIGEKPLAHETEVKVVQLIDPKKLH